MKGLCAIVLVLATAGLSSPATATSGQVDIKNFAFDPATITVLVGDSVTWQNQDSARHTSTADAGEWSSGQMDKDATFMFVFSTPGSFAYHCANHPGMKGTVIVRSSIGTPAAPGNLSAAPGSGIGDVALAWQPPTDDGGSPILGYRLCRTPRGGTPECLDAGTGTSYVDHGLQPLQSYDYVVEALNAFGAGADSNGACSKPFPWLTALGCAI